MLIFYAIMDNWPTQSRVKDRWSGLPWNLQVATGFLRNTGKDPNREIPKGSNFFSREIGVLIEQTFNREDLLYLACNENHVSFFFNSDRHKQYTLWSNQKM